MDARRRRAADGVRNVPAALSEEELRHRPQEEVEKTRRADYHRSGRGGPAAGAHERFCDTIEALT